VKCAIIEYENYSGKFPPIVIAIGPWWKLFPMLMVWARNAPHYALGTFSYMTLTAEIQWSAYAGKTQSTIRRIVEVGKDVDDDPFTKHLTAGNSAR